jgi:hypothetical protein
MMGEIARNMSSEKNTNKATLLYLVGLLIIIGIIYNMHGKTNLKFAGFIESGEIKLP